MSLKQLQLDIDTFTPTQQRMLDVLHDGMPHSVDELKACLPGGTGRHRQVIANVSVLRKRLESEDKHILLLSVFHNRKLHYRLVRKLANPYNGRS